MEPCTIGNRARGASGFPPSGAAIVLVAPAAPSAPCAACFAGVFVADWILGALVEHHQDVAAEGQLHVDGGFGRERVQVAVQMRLEDDALLGDFPQAAQAEDLEAAGIGEDGAGPRHEAVQPAQLADQFVPGPQKEMIGIGQQNLDVEIVGRDRAGSAL